MNILENIKYTVTKLEKSQIKVEVEINKALYETNKVKSLTRLAKDVTLGGFRKGNAPLSAVEAYLGASLIEDVLNKTIPEVSAEILMKEEFKPMDQLHYEVLDIDPTEEKGFAIKYSATFTNLPNIVLAKFSDIDVQKESPKSVTEEDIQRVIAQYEERKKNLEESSKESGRSLTEEETKIPSNEEIEENLKTQASYEVEQKYKSDILKQLCEKTVMEFPETLVVPEIAGKEKSYISRIESLGLKLEDFLKMQNTSIEELRKNWEIEARESIQVALVLGQVVRDNDITIEQEEVDEEMKNVKEYSNEEEKLRIMEYIRSVKLQQKALNFVISKVEGK